MVRDFCTELDAAAANADWEAHARIWEERRCAEVDHDEVSMAEWLVHSEHPIFNRKQDEEV